MSKATERLLHLFEIVANEGPIGLTDLAKHSGISRSATHRAAQVLEAHGWIRARLYDHAYEVSSKFDAMMADGYVALEEVELIAPIMADIARYKNFAADLGMFTRTGHFEVIESTERSVVLNRRKSLIASDSALMAQLALTPANQVRHLNAYLTTASEIERKVVTTGTHRQRLTEMQAKALAAFPNKIILPFESANNVGGALVIRAKRKSKMHRMEMRELAERAMLSFEKQSIVCPFASHQQKVVRLR